MPSYSQEGKNLYVNTRPVSCTGDGLIQARLEENEVVVEDVLYLLFQLPDEITIYLENSTGEFSDLREGSYLVRAEFEEEGELIQVEERVEIPSDFQQLSFSLQSWNLCGEEDGAIEVIVNEGEGASYELEGSINRPTQESPIFENLIEGAYTVWVTDVCGNKLSQNLQLFRPGLEIFTTNRVFRPTLPTCETISIGHRFRTIGAETEFPITAIFTIHPPGGNVTNLSVEIEEGDLESGNFFADIPFFHGQNYTYDLMVQDPCGNSDFHEGLEINRALSISNDIRWGAGFCGNRRISVRPQNFTPPYQINFMEYPEEFDPIDFNPDYPGPFEDENIFFGDEDNPIPQGSYRVMVEDACGNQQELSFNHNITISGPVFQELKSCEVGKGTVEMVSHDFLLEEVRMISAPDEYGRDMPLDLISYVNPQNKRRLYLSGLPPGTYEFEVHSTCTPEGITYFRSLEIEGGEVFENTVEVEENCGTFNLFLQHLDNLNDNQNVRFGLQKFNPETGAWGHPSTNQPYSQGQEITRNNAYLLDNQANNFNIPFTGRLRVVKSARVWKSGDQIQEGQSSHTFCTESLKTFEFRGRTILNAVNFFQCEDGSYDVSFSAEGYDPLNFQIREHDGRESVFDNGDNPLFSGLEGGNYKFRVEDRCGNVQNFQLQVAGENIPKIYPENLCPEENGRLFVPNLEFLEFEWHKEGAPNQILSQTSSLEFDSFDMNRDNGTYFVRLTHPDPNICLNKELSFEISEETRDPRPGQGQTARVCRGEVLDLFDFLEGPYGDHGKWEEITETGALIGNLWSAMDLPAGIYSFRYSIGGLCTDENSTEVTLELNEVPSAPEVEPMQEFCASDSPTLAEIVAIGDEITWFSELEGGTELASDTPLADGETYFAAQTINGCISSERAPVQVNVYPEFENVTIEGDQQVYQLEPPGPIGGDEPTGGKGSLMISWEASTDQVNWIRIEGAAEPEFQPDPLMESTFYRRVVSDEKCGEEISNEVLIEVVVAPVLAEGDDYGPLKGYETNRLPILDNDTFKGSAIDYASAEIVASVLEITDEEGEIVNVDWQFDEDGNLVVPEGTLPGRYTVRYQICQANIPENCSETNAEIWVGVLDLDIEKLVDRTQAVEGEIITYTIQITNTSDFDLKEIDIEDLLPENVMVIQATPDFSQNNSWESGNLPIGESIEFEIDVLTLAEGEIVNQVRVRIGDFDQTVESPVTQVRAKSVDLLIEKSTNAQEIVDGDEFIYTLIISNRGLDEATGVTIVDELPTKVDLVESRVSNNPDGLAINFSQDENRLIWEVDEFPVGSEVTITVTVTAMEVGTAENKANVSSEETDADESNNSDSVTVIIAPLFIPNVFKPDNDGKNDTFIIRASHKFSKISLLIFNRWGDPIYESEDYKNDWGAEGVSGGTYYYLIKGIDARNQERRYKGWVQVLK